MLSPEASLTVAVKEKVPALLVSPLIAPSVASSSKPEGKAPAASFHWYGAVPPEACRAAVYGIPSVASGRVVAVMERFEGGEAAVTLMVAVPCLVGSALLVAIS